MKNLKKIGMPIKPEELQEYLTESCRNFRGRLINEYIVINDENFK